MVKHEVLPGVKKFIRDKHKRTAGRSRQNSVQDKRRSANFKRDVLSNIVVALDEDLPPEVRAAVAQAGIDQDTEFLGANVILGMIGAYEWRKRGVEVIPGVFVYPHYGVFPPTRRDYLKLLTRQNLESPPGVVLDVGTGSGVLSIILAKKFGARKIIATDNNERAVVCARDNFARLEIDAQVFHCSGFPPAAAAGAASGGELADLAICNPPWCASVEPSSPLDSAVFDQDNSLLNKYMAGVKGRLNEGGQAWLIHQDPGISAPASMHQLSRHSTDSVSLYKFS